MPGLVVRKFLTTIMAAPYFDVAKSGPVSFYLQIDPTNGAAGEASPTETVYPWRGEEEMTLQVIAKWDSGSVGAGKLQGNPFDNPTLQGFNYLLIAKMQPYVGTRSYYNYADDDMPGGTVPLFSYFGQNAQRVLDISNKYADWRNDNSTMWELLPYRPGANMEMLPHSLAVGKGPLLG